MRVLILGGGGMLGHKLVQVFGRRFETWATIRGPFEDVARFDIFEHKSTIANLDVTDGTALRNALERVRPDVVINAVGIIKQLPEARNADLLYEINASLPKTLAKMSDEFGFRLICISTDCVFSGRKGKYHENDIPDPVDDYGQSKLAGEITEGDCLTVRTSMIGREIATGHSLVEWFLASRGQRVDGFVNVIYSGLPTIVLAKVLGDIIADHPNLRGIYHLSSDPISKFDLLTLINRHFDAQVDIEPDPSVVMDRSLDSSRFRSATGFEPATWDEMIRKMADDPTPHDEWRANK